MIADPLNDYWKSKLHITNSQIIITNILSQIKQQESQTNNLIINKYTKDNNRYIIEYYIKHLIPITKKYKKRKTKRTNIQVDVKSTNRTTTPQLNKHKYKHK